MADNVKVSEEKKAAVVASFYAERVVEIDYQNWRGERRLRRIVPRGEIRFGSNEWHKEKQWLLLALCLEKQQTLEFAMNGIYGWRVADDQSLPWRT